MDLSPEQFAARRRDYANGREDADDRHLKMSYEIVAGIPREQSVACSTAEDEAAWDRMLIEIEAAHARGLDGRGRNPAE